MKGSNRKGEVREGKPRVKISGSATGRKRKGGSGEKEGVVPGR